MRARSPERQCFLVDCLTTFVEGGPYSWFDVRKYKYNENGPEASAVLYAENPVEGPDWLRFDLTVDLFAKGIGKLRNSPNGSINSKDRGRILAASITNDAGDLDINDVDVIVQFAVFGECVYS